MFAGAMNRTRLVRLGLPVACGALALAALVQSAPAAPPVAAQSAASPAALAQTLIAPASTEIAPHTIVSFALAAVATDFLSGALSPVTRWVEATNQSDQTANVADDGDTLTINVPAGYIAVPSAACAPIDGDPSSVACPHAFEPGPSGDFRVAFTAVSADSAAPLPQTVRVPFGGSATIVADEGLTQAAIEIDFSVELTGGPEAPYIDAAWNGAIVTLVAPNGGSVSLAYSNFAQYASSLCGSPQGFAPILQCATPNGRSGLIAVQGTIAYHGPPNPGIHPPTPAPQPQTVLGGPYIGVAGQPIAMTGNATVCCGDAISGELWSFGDGALASGDDVTHAYVQPGLYTVSLRTSASYAVRDDTTTAIVFPADTTPALLDTITQPGSVQLPPGSAVTFDTLDPRRPAPATPVPDFLKSVLAANLSEQPATVTDDGSVVRVQVPDGYAVQLLPLGGAAEQHCQYGNEPQPTPAPLPTRTGNSLIPPPPATPPAPLIAANDTHASYASCPVGGGTLRAIVFTTVALNGG